MRLAQPVGITVGLGLMVTPAVLDYAGTAAGDLHRVVGPVAASLAVIAVWEATNGVRWPNVALAVVLVLAPLVVDHPAAAAIVGVVAGIALGVATPFAGEAAHRLGGGWRRLVGTSPATETGRIP